MDDGARRGGGGVVRVPCRTPIQPGGWREAGGDKKSANEQVRHQISGAEIDTAAGRR